MVTLGTGRLRDFLILIRELRFAITCLSALWQLGQDWVLPQTAMLSFAEGAQYPLVLPT